MVVGWGCHGECLIVVGGERMGWLLNGLDVSTSKVIRGVEYKLSDEFPRFEMRCNGVVKSYMVVGEFVSMVADEWQRAWSRLLPHKAEL